MIIIFFLNFHLIKLIALIINHLRAFEVKIYLQFLVLSKENIIV